MEKYLPNFFYFETVRKFLLNYNNCFSYYKLSYFVILIHLGLTKKSSQWNALKSKCVKGEIGYNFNCTCRIEDEMSKILILIHSFFCCLFPIFKYRKISHKTHYYDGKGYNIGSNSTTLIPKLITHIGSDESETTNKKYLLFM